MFSEVCSSHSPRPRKARRVEKQGQGSVELWDVSLEQESRCSDGWGTVGHAPVLVFTSCLTKVLHAERGFPREAQEREAGSSVECTEVLMTEISALIWTQWEVKTEVSAGG